MVHSIFDIQHSVFTIRSQECHGAGAAGSLRASMWGETGKATEAPPGMAELDVVQKGFSGRSEF